jgi:hypothetical protein
VNFIFVLNGTDAFWYKMRDCCQFVVVLGVKPVSVEWTVTEASGLCTADFSQAYDKLHRHDRLICQFVSATHNMPVNKHIHCIIDSNVINVAYLYNNSF